MIINNFCYMKEKFGLSRSHRSNGELSSTEDFASVNLSLIRGRQTVNAGCEILIEFHSVTQKHERCRDVCTLHVKAGSSTVAIHLWSLFYAQLQLILLQAPL